MQGVKADTVIPLAVCKIISNVVVNTRGIERCSDKKCSKVKHSSASMADVVSKVMKSRYGVTLYKYSCTKCNGYHLSREKEERKHAN